LAVSFSAVVAVITVLWVIGRVIIALLSKKIVYKRELQLLLIYMCIIGLTRLTFFPFHLVNGKIQPMTVTFSEYRFNLAPLVHLFDYTARSDLLLNVIGNCVMFIPIGFILPIVYKELNRFYKVLLTGFLLSFSIEITQLIFTDRMCDVDDLILNTVGCFIGYGVYCIVVTLTKSEKSRTNN